MNGLFGYNGFLCGAGIATFLADEWDLLAIVAVIVTSSLSSVCMVVNI